MLNGSVEWEYKVVRVVRELDDMWDKVNRIVDDLHSEGWATPGAVSSTNSLAVYIVAERVKRE